MAKPDGSYRPSTKRVWRALQMSRLSASVPSDPPLQPKHQNKLHANVLFSVGPGQYVVTVVLQNRSDKKL